MKLKFNPKLDYQLEAIDSIVDIFEGQAICDTNFTVPQLDNDTLFESNLGVGNKLTLDEEDILKNVQKIQLRNGLKQSKKLTSYDFNIEMETGTGKTYVYLRTIFELNKKYGFTKFVIVVPSIAIKEGVYKSLEITKEHFKALYDNVPYDYFIYDSQKLGQVRNFATNDYIQIMVINIDAFRKSFSDPSKQTRANIIHRENDRLNGLKPIEFVQETQPIVIIDEPQSVDTTPKAKKAIASLNPLFKLRYSATHKEVYNLMYKLDSVDAYERKLVKQIEVASIAVKDSNNQAYIKLLAVDNKKSPISATIELGISQNGKTKRDKRRVTQGEDLYELSGGREVYRGYIINDIYCEEGFEYIDFTSKPDVIRLGETIGNVDQDEIKRLQIRKTIEEHLDKELKLKEKGIKVLSLFFLDKVANYRYYDKDGYPQKGKYALIFEEEYKKIIKKPKYHTLFKDIEEVAAEKVHDGYFAIDRKKDANGEYRVKDSKGIYQADESAYNLIMKEKEKLLSFDYQLKFIFSHSALKEGWDNPNVFQICTLNETNSEMKKRQEIGRGLRIAVDQDGKRHAGFDINTLTIMANESYEDFAKALQKEIEEEEGIKFGIVEKHTFANVVTVDDHGQRAYLGEKSSENIWQYFLTDKYIDKKGLIQDKLREELGLNILKIPAEYDEEQDQIFGILKKIAGKLNIKNRDDRTEVNLNKAVYLDKDFKRLWDKIKYKTTYSVDFSVDELIERCANEIKNNLLVGNAEMIYTKAKTEISRGGVLPDEDTVKERRYQYRPKDYKLPDIISYLQNETQLTRKTIVEILVKSGRLKDFKVNPQKFIDEVIRIIQYNMRSFIVDGIKYEKIGDEEYYAQELFANEELFGYLSSNMLECKKSVYNYVVYDSGIEEKLARRFEKSDNVLVYAKLPAWFKIPTPLGSYNPDWAVLIEKDDEKKLYFVVESKGNINPQLLRDVEDDKIKCGRRHFKALEEGVKYTVVDSFDRLMHEVYQ
ncbi:DEAD/DEAH box helicase family protein [Halocella sp. SP3-1]|uniref:type III restriction-modification system endonuclease n=1 Tax=Halocella sp. SP3-1 TaxID=2382161 RepID=UPI000F761BE2|nr:DEAD/DEAH box helicase family protein [Halocella sp. SP3-1]AZO94946.1 type III restriction endonuclease subunit R [Halocella sp. SP3-1]